MSGEYWDSWDWRAVQKALVGDITTDGYTHVNEVRNGDPSSTLNLTSGLASLVLALNSALLNVRAQKKALIDNGVWAGDAADSFETLMRRMDKTLLHNGEQLGGNQGVIMALLNVYVAHKNGIERVIELNSKGATQAKERYDQQRKNWYDIVETGVVPPMPKQPWFTNSKGETIYTPSTYPDIDDKMSEEARGIMRDVVSVYRTKSALLRTVQPQSSLMTVSPVTPEFPVDGAPTNPGNPADPNNPVKPVNPGNPAGPPVSPALPVNPGNPAGPPGSPSPGSPVSPVGPPVSPVIPSSPASPGSPGNPVGPPVSPVFP
ncbi:MAG: hypothetical protein QG608_784, partial [Actinomycetota bacterium]|nr:hypothetical protein [Actinomycetota bacterium]